MFVNDLMENLEHIEEMEFAGGEPLLDPLHFKLISQIPNPENVILKYSTNLTNLEFKNGRNVLDIWRNFAGIRLTISIDGYRELNSMIRHGSDWNTLKQNIKQCKQVLGNKLQTIRGSTTISAMNALYLTETMDAIENDLGIRWHTSRLTVPEFLHANVLDPVQLTQQREQLLERIKPLEDTVEDIKDYGQKLITINKIRHIRDSERWLKECIDSNRHTEYWSKYQEFMNIMDEEDTHELL
jgi:sulfatase maturation enzyme AslB (radical SAM superfamily)